MAESVCWCLYIGPSTIGSFCILSLRWWREAGGVARELLQAMLELGLEPNDYARLLDDMADVLPSVPGRADVELLVESGRNSRG